MGQISVGIDSSYKVNALGQRVYKKKGSAVTHFVYDEAGHLIGEYKGSGALSQETIYLGDIPVGVWRSDGLYFIHADHLNTPRAILDQANRVVWLWRSEPFGSLGATNDPDGDGVKFFYNLRFPGQYFDSETGLFYNYFRDYDPRLGQYMSSDPIGLGGGLNPYTYVGNRPVTLTDPTGESAIPGAVAGVCAIIAVMDGYATVRELRAYVEAQRAIEEEVRILEQTCYSDKPEFENIKQEALEKLQQRRAEAVRLASLIADKQKSITGLSFMGLGCAILPKIPLYK